MKRIAATLLLLSTLTPFTGCSGLASDPETGNTDRFSAAGGPTETLVFHGGLNEKFDNGAENSETGRAFNMPRITVDHEVMLNARIKVPAGRDVTSIAFALFQMRSAPVLTRFPINLSARQIRPAFWLTNFFKKALTKDNPNTGV